jgi:adenine phosphoribosyltransferase
MDIRDSIRTIPDFPKPGIQFRDVTTLFGNAQAFRMAIDSLLHPYAGTQIDKIAALEARGFILGGAVAHQLSIGFVPIRKAGKLPGAVMSEAYTLEYGEATMQLHEGALAPGERVLLVDDLIATGGTCEAGINLIRRSGAEVAGCAFIIDLPALGGRERVEAMGVPVHVLCEFDGD